MITNRKPPLSTAGRSTVTDQAATGAAKARPVRAAASTSGATPAAGTAPNAQATRANAAALVNTRNATNSRWPRKTSAGPTGVAVATRYAPEPRADMWTGPADSM